jgi:prolyl oligopeptidase
MMLKIVLALSLAGLLSACAQHSGKTGQPAAAAARPIQLAAYPTTRKGDTVDSYFESEVADPYRWLEDDRGEATADWVQAQNAVTFSYLDQIPYRDALQARLETLWNYERISAPFREGNYTYYYRNDGLQDQAVIYRIKGDGEAEVFLDPNTFSEDGTTSLDQLSFSRDGSIAAYSISEAGSDWRKVRVIDVETGELLEQPLVNVKFSGMEWQGNAGFYYSSYDKPGGSELSAKTDQHKLYFHRLGSPQQEDRLVFGGTPAQKRRYVSASVTDDDRYLAVYSANSTSGNELYIKDLRDPAGELVAVLEDFESDTQVIDNEGSTLYLLTNRGAPNKKIVKVDASRPAPANWSSVIPESANVMSPVTIGGNFVVEYMVDATSRVYRYDRTGRELGELQLPGIGSFNSRGGKRDEDILYYSFTNYKQAPTIYAFDLNSTQTSLYHQSGANFASEDYISRQVFYTSRDGTRVPMIITHRKGLELDGSNPTMLYGYGGFNVSLTPAFSIANAVWLEQGGVYAVPNLRGGGEYGKDWHKAGTGLQKQNVFDDFIAAANYLIEQGYTSSDYLALRGGSNGGLLVGAVMTQQPDLARVALPAVGVLDMLRYHTFTSGAGWAYDYGTSAQSEAMFNYLQGYSPLHNLQPGTHYPATLITTGDHDDRVVPAHSFKFAATLQADQGGDAPVLIRIETKAGHGAGTPVSKRVQQYADIFGFTLYNMGVTQLAPRTTKGQD